MFKQTQPTFSYSDLSGAQEQLAYISLILALHILEESSNIHSQPSLFQTK